MTDNVEIWNALLAANSLDAVIEILPVPPDLPLALAVLAEMHGVEVPRLSDDQKVALAAHIKTLKGVTVKVGDEVVPAMVKKGTN